MIDDIVILFQEVSESDKKLADQYNIRYIGLKDNIGIGKGMKTLAENAVCENILFLEHDFELVEDQKTVFSRLKSGLKMLDNGFDVVRYRSRNTPVILLFPSGIKEMNWIIMMTGTSAPLPIFWNLYIGWILQ